MSVRSSISHVPQQQLCTRLHNVLHIGTQTNAVNLRHSTPVEGAWRRISRRYDKDYQNNLKEFKLNQKDYERNKKEFSPKVAMDWFDYVEAIRNFKFSWIREGLSSIYHKVSPEDYLLDLKLYFRGELSSLVDVARKYYLNELDVQTRVRREDMYLSVLIYSKEYANRKKKAATKKEIDASSS